MAGENSDAAKTANRNAARDNDSNRTGGVSSTSINQEKKTGFDVISALPMHLCTFGRVGMPVIHISIGYSLGKWRESGVIMARRSIMIMMV